MIPARSTAPAAVLLLLAAAVPAAAQPAETPPAAPPVWQVRQDPQRGTVEIAATAIDGSTRFVGGCSRSRPDGLAGAFSGYRGKGLRTDGTVEVVAVYARGEGWQDAFAVRLRYSPARGAWEIAKPLAPVFLSSFSRGGSLAVVNSRNEEVFSFDLTGSTAATRVMRDVCGFE